MVVVSVAVVVGRRPPDAVGPPDAAVVLLVVSRPQFASDVMVMMVVVVMASATDVVSVIVITVTAAAEEEPVREGRVGRVRPLVVVVGHGHGVLAAARPHKGRRHLHFLSSSNCRFLVFVTYNFFFFFPQSELSSPP